MVTTKLAVATCSVCSLTTRHPIVGESGEVYCCTACREVASLLAAPSELKERFNDAIQPEFQEELTLTMGDMWCSSCAWLVSEKLNRTPGVISAEVNFIQQKAAINYDQSLTNARKLKKRIRSLGYSATLPDENPKDEEMSLFMRLAGCSALVIHDLIVSFTIYGRQLLGLESPDTQWLVVFFQVMMLVSSLPVLYLLGWPILRAGFASLVRGQPNIHTLITIGTFSAFILSVRNLIVGSDGLYFDTASMLIYLVAVGRYIEIKAQKASTEAVESLMKEVPETANLVTVDGEESLPVSELQPGMRLRVRPGERFPVDGLVASGFGDVDESLLTGEPKPVNRGIGDTLRAGTINLDGVFEIVSTAVGSETTAGQISQLLHQALWKRSPLEQKADKIAGWMTPVALTLATGTFLFWGSQQGVEHGLLVALSVLLIACPCALGLATPLTLWLSLGRAAESGAILRSTAALEKLNQIDAIFFDKTGTLSQLPLKVQELRVSNISEIEFLQRVADIENASEHPLAKAILDYAVQNNILPGKVDEFKTIPGFGLWARRNGDQLWVGNHRMMARHNLQTPGEFVEVAKQWHLSGKIVIYAGWHDQVKGVMALGETMRPEVGEMIGALTARGLNPSILTGDDAKAGAYWQEELGVLVSSALSPADKMDRLQNSPGHAAMVGDGINDGPALAVASVGLALSQGTDVAQSTADIILVREDLRMIPWLFDLSEKAMLRVRQIWSGP